MTDRCTCHAAHAVNEVLIKLMGERIKQECSKLLDAGMSIDEINQTLAEDILPFYESWRRETLARAMREIEGMTATPDDRAPVTPLRH